MRTIDIFCGAGGLSEGFREAGFDMRLGLDLAPHACATHQANFTEGETWCRDVREVTGTAVRDTAGGRVEVVVGGPNCQGVSERGMRDPKDPRNDMFWEFARLIEELQPRAFLMENVAGLTHRHNWPILQKVVRTFQRMGYGCAGDVVRAADYGAPQLRHRFVLIGARGLSGPISFPRPTHGDRWVENDLVALAAKGPLPHHTLRDAISDLPSVESGGGIEVATYGGRARTAYQQELRQQATALYNLGVTQDKLGQPAAALDYYREALAVQRAAGLAGDVPDSLRSMAISLIKLDRASESLGLLDEADALPGVQADPGMRAALQLTRGAALRQLGRPAESLALLDQARAWFETTAAAPFLEKIEDERARALKALGRHAQALAARERQIELKDAMHQAWRAEQTARLRVEFDTDRFEQQNRALATENAPAVPIRSVAAITDTGPSIATSAVGPASLKRASPVAVRPAAFTLRLASVNASFVARRSAVARWTSARSTRAARRASNRSPMVSVSGTSPRRRAEVSLMRMSSASRT